MILDSMLDNLPGAVFRSSADNYWMIEYISGGIEDITGYPDHRFLGDDGLTLASITHADDYGRVQREVDEAVSNDRPYNIEYRVNHAQGLTKWVAEQGRAVRGAAGELQFIDGTIVDVTDRRRAEAALKESEVRFRSIVEDLPGAVYHTDDRENTTMDYLSDGIEELLGFTPEELVGNPERTYEMQIHPDDAEIVYSKVKQNFEDHEPLNLEYRVLHKDGSILWVLERGHTYMRGEGKGQRLCGVLIDVTAKKRAEIALESHRVRLIEQASELERSNAELDSFAYIASHDLKEPLRGIANYSGFLIEDYEDKLDDDGKAKLHTLARLSARMESLLNALLAYSRVGREELVLESVPLSDVIADIRENLAARLDEQGAEIRAEGPLPVLMASRERITEVFQNLVSNGVKYNDNPQKTVEIGVAVEPPQSSPSGLPAEAVVCYVRDNGIGIPEKYRDSVFAIFKRLHGRDEYGGGTGAGLTIVRKIIEQSGGRIWFDSVEGEGSTFYLALCPHREDEQTEQIQNG